MVYGVVLFMRCKEEELGGREDEGIEEFKKHALDCLCAALRCVALLYCTVM